MVRALKEFAKNLPYPVLLRLYYGWAIATQYRRFESVRKQVGFPLLDEVDLSQVKSSDTVFLFGSGPSINQISAERWQAISRANSIGLNFWLYHPFVPTLYVTESVSYTQGNPEVCRRLLEAMQRRAGDYRETIKIITDLYEPGPQYVFDIDPGFRHNLYAAYDIPMPARDESEFAAGLRYLEGKGLFRVTPRIRALFKYSFSLPLLLSLGLRMGYRNIVLCGFDMGPHESFYHDPELFPEESQVRFYPVAAPHVSAERVPWMIPQPEMVAGINELLLRPAGVNLYVENRSSKLWPKIPEAPPSLFELLPASSRAATRRW